MVVQLGEPQPFGLFFSKAPGPHTTKHIFNVLWDATFDDVAACRYRIRDREDAANKCYIEAPRTMCRCQGADDACALVANLSDTPELIRAASATTSEEFLDSIALVDSIELRHWIEPHIPLLGCPWAFLASPVGYGYGMERAIALACVGDDAVWLPLSQSLVHDLSSLQTGDQNEPSKNLQWACRAAKIDGKVAKSYASLVSSGHDTTNIQVEYLKLSLLSHAMKRPLVMLYEGSCKQIKAAIVVPELHDPAACQACPIIVVRKMEGAGLTWSALIPFRTAGAPLLLTCVKLSQMVHLCEASTAVGRYVTAAYDTLVVFTPNERCGDGIAERLRNECTALRAGDNLMTLPADTPEAASEQRVDDFACTPMNHTSEGVNADWESLDTSTGQWIPYEPHVSGKIESAFAAGEQSISVEIVNDGFSCGFFTINFPLMQQQNMQMGGSRSIRRAPRTAFDCVVCTYHNECKGPLGEDVCAMCGTPRPAYNVRNADSAATPLRGQSQQRCEPCHADCAASSRSFRQF